MKVPENLNTLAILVKLGKITQKDGLNRIAADILEHPFNYGLHQFDEEFQSEVILSLLQKGPDLFNRYNPTQGQFKTYLCSLIRYQIKEILRANHKKEINEKHIAIMSMLDYENSVAKYNAEEPVFALSDFKPHATKHSEQVPFRDNHTLQSYINKKNNEELDCIKLMGKYKKKNQIKKTALILALKSCCYITDSHIENLSEFCGIPKEKLISLVEELKDSLEDRRMKLSKIQNSRDREFLLKRNLEEEINNSYESKNEERLVKFYDLHKKHWTMRNSELQNKNCYPSPTNKKVAEVLGICERQVGNYLQHADEVIENFLKNE
ncbi:MAG: hypothetical protein IJL70_09660 [Treponema sp.]|nr:hypothetical protein [Treponema sp.]